MIKKLPLSLLFLAALLLAGAVSADLGDLALHQQTDKQDSILWPMLPNESLVDLAAKFYPNNKAMQRKFISKAKQLNKDSQSAISPHTRNAALTTIVIPNLRSLSVAAGSIKRSRKKSSSKALRLSYNVKSAVEKVKLTFQNIPARLIEEYENLVVRNTFLKEEIAKLNIRLVFLHDKLGELKLVLDRTLTLPTKKAFKNLDAEKAKIEKKPAKPTSKPVAVVTNTQPTANPGFFDFSNKLLWLSLLAFGVLLMLGSYLYKKYQERKYLKLVNAISQQNQATAFDIAAKTEFQGGQMPPTTLNKDGVLQEFNSDTILQEAKGLVAQNSPDEAIDHLKWAIKAEPKTGINVWLYLLDLFRTQDLKNEFEKFSFKMHQHFNVMTPLWEERQVAMVVQQSLEEFPYIIKLLTEQWPSEKIVGYLQKLISDNRSGERAGFSQAVVEEALLLIDVLEVRAVD